jgi:hypothetical protein
VFGVDSNPITSIDELQDGQSYVASSTEVFKAIDYDNVKEPVWNFSTLRGNIIEDVCFVCVFWTDLCVYTGSVVVYV